MPLTDAQYAAFVDRVIACREAEDRAKEDTKQVYAEIAEAGEDKTAIGIFVREHRMTAKEKAKAQFRDAAVEDARERYRRGKASHVRAREAGIRYDADGVIIEDTAETPKEAAHTSHVGAARQAEEEVRASSAAIPEHLATVSTDPLRSGAGTHMDAVPVAQVAEVGIPASAQIAEPQPTAAQTEGPSSLPTSVAGPEAVESPAINSEAGIPVSASEPVGAPSADADDRDASLASSHTGVPVVTNLDPVQLDRTKPAPWCADPEDCGVEASWNHTCGSCLRRRAQGDVMRAVQ